MGTTEQTSIIASLATSVEPSGACIALHCIAFVGNGGSWKDMEERRGASRSRARGDLQYIVPHKYK
jgi:hypothetical protein